MPLAKRWSRALQRLRIGSEPLTKRVVPPPKAPSPFGCASGPRRVTSQRFAAKASPPPLYRGQPQGHRATESGVRGHRVNVTRGLSTPSSQKKKKKEVDPCLWAKPLRRSPCGRATGGYPMLVSGASGRVALEGKGPQTRLDRRLEEVAKAVGGRLLSVTNTIEAGTWRQEDRGWA